MSRGTAGRAGDLWGGFASMLVALPSAIGFGITIYAVLGPEYAGRGALAGLIGTFALGIVAPLFGGSRFLISAPCGPAALLLAALTADLLKHSHGETAPAATVLLVLSLVGLLSAGLQFAYGALGGGRLIKFIPYPVVAGYLSCIGVLLFAKQVPDFLGLSKGTAAASGLVSPDTWAAPSLVVGGLTAGAMLLAPHVTKRVPAVIIGLGTGCLGYALLGIYLPQLRELDGNPLVIGALAGKPSELAVGFLTRFSGLGALSMADLGLAVVPAITLSVLLSIDTLKTTVIVDALTRTRSDSNKELRGQGLGNLAAALLGGIPGAGTMGATMVNVVSGGESRRAGVFEGASALVAFVLFGGSLPGVPSLIGWLPKAALAGIIMVIAFRMIDRHSFFLLRHRTTWPDFLVVVAVIVTGVTTSPIAAAAVGLALAIMLFTRDQIRGSVVRRKMPGNRMASKRQRPPEELALLQQKGAEAIICSLQGTLFFGTTDQLVGLLDDDIRICRYLVLDLRRVQSIDYTAGHMLAQIDAQLGDRGAHLLFSGQPLTLPKGLDLRGYFKRLDFVPRPGTHLVEDLDRAVEWIENDILSTAGMSRVEAAAPLALADFDLFGHLGKEALYTLAQVIEPRHLDESARLFCRGDDGDEIYLIRSGAVQILLPIEGGRRHHLATFARGSFFGDMAFLDGDKRSADAVAGEPTDLFVLSRRRFDELSGKHPDIGTAFFSQLARSMALRLRQTDAQLQALAET